MLSHLVAVMLLAAAFDRPSGETLRHWGSFRVESRRIGGSFEVEIVSDTLPQLGDARHVRLTRTEHLRTLDGTIELKLVKSLADSATCPSISKRLALLPGIKLPPLASPFQQQPGSKTVLLDGSTSKIDVPLENSDDGSHIEISISSYEQPSVTAWIGDTMRALQPCWRAESS